LTVIEISTPVVDGKDLVYSYKLVEGKSCREDLDGW